MPHPTPSLARWLILAAVLAAHAAALWGLTSATPLRPAASAEPSRLVAELITLEPAPSAPARAEAEPAKLARAAPARPLPTKAKPAATEVTPPPATSASSNAPLAAAADAASQPSDAPSTAIAAEPSPATHSTAGSLGEGEAAITPPSAHASHLSNRAPRYPAISRRLGEEGEVVLRMLILADGSVGAASVERSSGHPRLDAAALAAARQWRFAPARRDGQALDAWHTQALVFQLDA